ncbi:MAG: hypothetical protein SF182_02355 [Deltaproteobacteria bacterium]|nr:hypothetical protein [Deltaproteobacteria bacterium]
MPLSLQAATEFLRTLVRGIDRKADLTVTAQPDSQAGVVLAVELRKCRTTVNISASDIEGAMEDAILRAQLRTKVKGAIDRMTFKAIPFASTKMVRGAVVDGGFFRANSPGGGQRGGRR